MRCHRFFYNARLGVVFGALCAIAVAQTAAADQVPVTYGLPSDNQANNLTNVSGQITLPIYGSQNFSTSTHVHGTIPTDLSVDFNISTHAATLTGLSFVPSLGSISFDNMSMHMAWNGFWCRRLTAPRTV